MAKTKTFTIDYLAKESQQRYEGTFTTKKLTIRDMSTQAVRKTQLNGGYHYDGDNPGCGIDYFTDRFNDMLAHLSVAITSSPDWWNLDELDDVEVIKTVFQEVLDFENSFRRQRDDSSPESGKQDTASEASGEKTSAQSDSSGAATKVVGSEVQAALEP